MLKNYQRLRNGSMDASLQREINETLHNLKRDEKFNLVKVLKINDHGRTEKVLSEDSGEFFIRKYIKIGKADEGSRRVVHELLAKAHLPQVAQVIDCYQYADELVIISEYIEGLTLFEYVKRAHPLPIETLERLIFDISTALSSLHRFSEGIIVHRDITPSNVIIYQDEDGQPRAVIIDFGVARLFDEAKSNDTQYLGTVGFAAPEQYGFGQTCARSDVYSLGAVLYFCLTAKNPTNNLIDKLASDNELPRNFKSVVIKAMALDPKDRYPSVKELCEAVIGMHPRKPAGLKSTVLLQHHIIKPTWYGPQRIKLLRIAWNIILLFIFAMCFYVLLINPGGVESVSSSKLFDYGKNASLLLFLFTPALFLSLDIFGFYKRFQLLRRFSWVAIFITLTAASFVTTLLAFGLFISLDGF